LNKKRKRKTYKKIPEPRDDSRAPFVAVVVCSGSGGGRVWTRRGGNGHVWTRQGCGSRGMDASRCHGGGDGSGDVGGGRGRGRSLETNKNYR
jgi:hypothetical protein